ncbi:MAG: LamG-like jellyroll fold domain-containing protein [bacterium]
MQNNKTDGFTLVELIIVFAILSILAAAILIGINPAKNTSSARNAVRASDNKTLLTALDLYSVDNTGQYPSAIDGTLRMLGTDNTGCNILCGKPQGTQVSASSIADQTSSDFNQGTYSNTQWSGTNTALELTTAGKTAKTGTFTSRIFNTGSPSTWSSFLPVAQQPYGKELPNNGASETQYSAGNANMTGNVLLLHLNEASGTLVDSSNTSNNATKVGNPTYGVTGQFNTALSFNSSADYLTINNNSSLNPPTAMTLEAWVKWNISPSTGAQWATIAGKGDNAGYLLQHNNTNTAFEFAVQAATNRTYILSTTTPTMGTWYHVVGTYDGTSIRLYVNGIQERTGSLSGAPRSTANPFQIARSNGGRSFIGNIDELAFYNRALSATEVLNHYQRGALHIEHQIRSCSNNTCTGSTFIGPNGTAGTYYTELTNTTTGLPSYDISNLGNNQYFQYQTVFRTSNTTYSPLLKTVSTQYNTSSLTGEMTASSCIDLSPQLAPYITKPLLDPKVGTTGKSYYAVRKNTNGRIAIVNCYVENP